MGLSIGTLLPLRWRLWLGMKLFKPPDYRTYRVSWNRVIKGPCQPPEVEAMQYVANHTNIPIAKLYAVHTQGNDIYIEMPFVRGDTLDCVWHRLSQEGREAIATEITEHLTILRRLPPPGGLCVPESGT